MLSKLGPEHYLSAEIFAQEQQRIFRKLWLFATFRTALAEPGAFATRTMAGLPVLLQNCGGEIRAFENLCPHRQMPLQSDAFGQGRMVCPYHGWVFDDAGRVKSIPHETTLYRYPPEERGGLCLRRYAVALIGNLVFINLSPDPMALDEQFTPEFQRSLADISAHFGAVSLQSNIRVRYNWKLNYENVLDYNHIPYIHPKTFQAALRKGASSTSEEVPDDQGGAPFPRDLHAQSCSNRAPMHIEPQPWHAAVERYGEGDFFHGFFVYPNVNFISPGGLSFIVQQFDPLAPGLTDLRMTLTLAREKQEIRGLPALLRTTWRGEVAVVNEDIGHLEALQSHLHTGAPRAHHGAYEDQLQAHADVYLKLLHSDTRS